MKNKFKGGIFLIILIFIIFSFPIELFGESWLKVDVTNGEKIWINTSHWESKKVWVSDGYFKEVSKKEWVDTSYTVNQGYWKAEEYRVWVTSSTLVPYTAYRWVDTSHWERRYRYVEKWVSVNLTIYVGTDKYGWSVYSFASHQVQDCIINYNGNRYKAHKWVIDYRPSYGGRVYAIKYLCYEKEVRVKEYYNVWVSSGYWQSYTTYKSVDTSHWETGTRCVWVDTSYVVSSGYWRYYTGKEWVDTSHYEFKTVWVADGFFSEPIHGEVTVEKNPAYIFTKWHKNQNNEECSMKLNVNWEIDNSDLPEGEEEKEIVRIYIYQDIYRFDSKGIERVTIFNGNVPHSVEGSVNTITKFDYSGSEESILHIYLYSQSGESAHIYFNNPINGFRSINLVPEGSGSEIHGWAEIIMVKSNFNSSLNKGSILIIVAILLPVFILLAGFVIDIGRAFLYKEEINKACMIAAEEASKCINIEAAQELGINRLADNYSDIINEYFYKNYNNDAGCTINYLSYNVIENIDNPRYIEVYCEADVSCFFLKIISINDISIHSKANGRLRAIR